MDTNEALAVALQDYWNEDQFDILFQRFTPLFKKCCHLYRITGFDYDDYLQEGRIALYKAIQQFDFERQSYFASFLQLVYKNHLYNLMRKETASKRGGAQGSLILDTEASEILQQYHYHQPESFAILHEKSQTYVSILSPLEKKVFLDYLACHDFAQIAADLHLPEKQIKNAYDRCRQKFKRHLLE
ncbi:MAG: sigma-70 family RNA polymerase sigma factor [Aerococcaceae bacterium]|nr:sigma-70 family RNA polymerase sigma factor [Aerococcaceae bacterium]